MTLEFIERMQSSMP